MKKATQKCTPNVFSSYKYLLQYLSRIESDLHIAKSNSTKSDHTKSNATKSNAAKSNSTKSNETTSNDTKSNTFELAQTQLIECASVRSRFTKFVLAFLMLFGGWFAETRCAEAQVVVKEPATALPAGLILEPTTGSILIDRNAFQIETGDFSNSSNIALPEVLTEETSEGASVPTTPQVLAPNSIEFRTDTDYINEAFSDAVSENGDEVFQIRPDTVRITKEFNINRSEGNHAFGEGIEVIVTNADGEVVSQEQAFVRGDDVQIGPNGEVLPESNQITVEYGADDTVELRVLNIREDNAEPSESGIYFNADGEFIVEDFEEGGDRDFNDGEYVENPTGRGEAIAAAELNAVTVETTTDETPLDPSIRVEEITEQDIVEVIQELDAMVEEERDWGEVALPESNATRLGHARGALSEDGDLLIYDRYAATNQFRLGSNGIGISGQLRPLSKNPRALPTLLFGNANFDPFVGDNEAGLVGTLGVTQFLTRTHREATDMFGGALPKPDGHVLVEPTGLFNNRRMIGYVPPTPEQTVMREALSSIDGVFEIPDGQRVAIAAPNSSEVGRGNAAYTRNVGGVLIESPSGDISFIPQWTGSGYEQDAITLEPGEAQRVIYALVPQQAGQNIAIGQRYAVVNNGGGYRIAEGNFTIISADKQPQNFQQEMPEVYAVEDTLPGLNAVTAFFNGIQGVYSERAGAQPVPTVDPDIPAEADARVGSNLFFADFIPGDPGQMAYAQVTRAGGFYLGGALTGGIGNQQDQVRRTTTEMSLQTDELRTTQITNTFLTPLMQMDSIVTETTVITENFGTASFDIDSNGELTNVSFVENGDSSQEVFERELERISEIVLGEETQVESEVNSVELETISAQLIEGDTTTSEGRDSYANVSSLEGELAIGGVYNFGNTPWSQAANTVRAELFARDSVFGRSGSETGWRAEVVFHPFGEVKRDAFQYDQAGNAVPVYKTRPVLDASGEQVIQMLTGADGALVELVVNQFVTDDNGDRVAQRVGTGTAKGPGVYLRVEDSFDDEDGVFFAGGLQFTF